MAAAKILGVVEGLNGFGFNGGFEGLKGFRGLKVFASGPGRQVWGFLGFTWSRAQRRTMHRTCSAPSTAA